MTELASASDPHWSAMIDALATIRVALNEPQGVGLAVHQGLMKARDNGGDDAVRAYVAAMATQAAEALSQLCGFARVSPDDAIEQLQFAAVVRSVEAP